MPDYHSAYDYLSSLFFSFLFIRLIEMADSTPEKTLSTPCLFLLDEFPNIAGINDFKKKLATIRSRNMHASIVFQDISQLEDRYPNKGWTGIIGNCDSRLFLGANDQETAKFVETLLGKSTVITKSFTRNAGPKGWFEWGRETARPEARNLMNLDEVLRLPLDEAILLLRGQNPLRIKKMDYSQHPLASRLVERNINDYLPPWAKEYSDSCPFELMDTVHMNANTPDTSGQDKRCRSQNYSGRKGGSKQSESAKDVYPSRSVPFFPSPSNWK